MTVESIAAMDWFEAELGNVEGLSVAPFYGEPTKADELASGQAVAIVDLSSDSQNYDKGSIHPIHTRNIVVSVYAKIEKDRRPSDVLDAFLFKLRRQFNAYIPQQNKPMAAGEYRVTEETAQKQSTQRTDTLAVLDVRYALQYKVIQEP